MKRYILSILFASAILNISAQEALHIRSHWSNYNIPIEEIDSITIGTLSNSDKLPALMANDPNISLFYEALLLTGMADSLNVPIYDYSYTGLTDEELEFVSSYRNPDDIYGCFPIHYEKRMFTAFVESNEVYAKYGIYDIEDLKTYAAKIYDEVYPEDAGINDPTNRRNSLNRFISYHLLDRFGDIDNLVAATMTDYYGRDISGCFFLNRYDAYDCYETMMPHSLLKISYGGKTQYKHYINRKYGYYHGGNEYKEYKIMGSPIVVDKCDYMASNGVYHYIDQIISYDKETQNTILLERLTFDISTLSPEFANSEIRHNRAAFLLPSRMMKNISYGGNQHLVYEPGVVGYWCYQTDELLLLPPYDSTGITLKLPPVPAGWYQLCFSVVPMAHRGVVQFYIDDEPCGEPVDLRKDALVYGWFSDYDISEEEIIEKENEFRENGWMKGLKNHSSDSSNSMTMRQISATIRRIVGYYYTDGKTNHYLRIKPVDGVQEIMLDYIQLTPKGIYDWEHSYPYE